MNAQILQLISVTAFIVSGILLSIAVILFFRLEVPAIINDLNGKTAARQIRELREKNRQSLLSKGAGVPYDNGEEKRTDQQLSGMQKGKDETDQTNRLKEEETELSGESTQRLENESTELLEYDDTMLLDRNSVSAAGFRLTLEEMVIHTEERIV